MMLLIIFFIEGLLLFLLRQGIEMFNYNYEFWSTLIIILNSLIFIIILPKYAKNKQEYFVLLGAYCFRLFFLYWDIFAKDIFVLPGSGLDTEMFHGRAVTFANGGDVGRGGNFSTVIGYIYMLFGEQRILAQYFISLLSMYSIVITNKILELANISDRIKLISLILISFLPYFAILSSILLREMLVVFFVTMSLYYFIKWWESAHLKYFILAIIFPVFAAAFHSGAIAISVSYIFIYIFYDVKVKRFLISYKTVFLAMFFWVLLITFNELYADTLLRKFQGVDSFSEVVSVARTYSSGGSSYSIGNNASNPIQFLFYTPIRILYFIGSPLPWNWRGIFDIISFFLSSSFYLMTYLIAFKALKKSNNNKKQLIISILVTALISALTFAWGVSNSGTAMRHRDKFLPVYIILIALSIENIKPQIEATKALYKDKKQMKTDRLEN